MSQTATLVASKIVLIFVGSGIGGVFRFTIGGWVQRLFRGSFPVGTLFVNVLGCLLIGFLAAAFAGRWPIREEYRMAIIVGVLGGFTTFSAFGLETFSLISSGRYYHAAAVVSLSIVLGLVAVWGGYRLADALL